jgi:predicted sulfurtransferase
VNEKIERLKESLQTINDNTSATMCVELKKELLQLNVNDITEEADLSFFIDVVEWEVRIDKLNKYKLMKLLVSLHKRMKILNKEQI